jgi:hypothetical protein
MEYIRSDDDLYDLSDNKCFSGTTKLVLTEAFKEFVKKTIIIDAQNINSKYYLSNITVYGIYHDQLLRFMQNINPKYKESQTDNLAYVLLLTYPIEMIDSFLSFQDLNLAFQNGKKSDFTDRGFKCISYENEEICLNTCICNERLKNIYVFENNFTNIRFQLGCECVLRHKLLDKNDPNYISNGKKIKEYRKMEKDRMEEKKRGLPDGFLNLERIRLKEEKQKEKQEKLLLKEKKDKENIDKQVFEKNNKLVNQKKGIQYCSNNCQLCNTYCIMDSKNRRRLCSKCLKKYNHFIMLQKLVMEQFIKTYLFCVCCGKDFISENIHSQLCKVCDDIYRLDICKLCKKDYIDDKYNIAETDVYCLDCDKKSSKCIDCKIVKFTEYSRCNDCFKKKANIKNITNNKNTYTKFKVYCQMKDCDTSFEINECDKKWKKFCDECFKKIKKEKVNCITINCSNSFVRNDCDIWKKKCPSCYDKYK